MNPILGKPVHDIMQVKGKTKALTVTNVLQEVKVGTSRLENRKIVVIYNNGTETIDYGFEDTLTYGQGIPVPSGESEYIACSDNVTVYVIGPPASSTNVRILEGY
jgi:hypothetical protein